MDTVVIVDGDVVEGDVVEDVSKMYLVVVDVAVVEVDCPGVVRFGAASPTGIVQFYS